MQASRLRSLLCGLVVVVVASTAGMPSTHAADDPQTQRDQVRRQKAAAAQDVDALRASAAEVTQALADLQDNANAEQAGLDAARQAEAHADQAVTEAQQREVDVQGQITDIKAALRFVAVDAYISGRAPADEATATVPVDGEGLVRQGYLESQAHRDVELVDNLHLAETELTAARQEAQTNAAIATQERGDAEQRVASLTAARTAQQTFAAQVEQRVEQRLDEIQNLNTLDQQLSARIAADEAALAARLPPITTGNTGGPPVANVALVTVRGITVAASIAPALDKLLSAAAADGIALGGSGYRDPAAQWRLRQQNCPDPANSPPFDCTPPTARAGTSMHEQGLAIDFTYQGAFITSDDNPGFKWLAANAARFGFKNLASEPWHWSTTGE